nr:MAG TPA: hypothetical protein [Bacteriophage sp.]
MISFFLLIRLDKILKFNSSIMPIKAVCKTMNNVYIICIQITNY